MTHIRILPVLLTALALGCGGSKHSAADVERGRTALTAALDSWKNNEPPDKLKALSEPVSFTEEMRRTHKLVDYALGPPNTTDPAVIRYPVTLKLQGRKGKAEERPVVFEVKLANPILVARDPYE